MLLPNVIKPVLINVLYRYVRSAERNSAAGPVLFSNMTPIR
jgi:hypothetical protein